MTGADTTAANLHAEGLVRPQLFGNRERILQAAATACVRLPSEVVLDLAEALRHDGTRAALEDSPPATTTCPHCGTDPSRPGCRAKASAETTTTPARSDDAPGPRAVANSPAGHTVVNANGSRGSTSLGWQARQVDITATEQETRLVTVTSRTASSGPTSRTGLATRA